MALRNYYIFDGNANDMVGSSNGTPGGSPAPALALGRFVRSGGQGAYDFAGGHNTLESTAYPRINFTRTDFEHKSTGSFSFLAWFKADVGSVFQTIAANRIDGTNGHILLWLRDTNVLQFQVEDTSNRSAIATTTGTYADGNWHMVVGSWNTSTAYAHIDVDNGLEHVSANNASAGTNFYSTSAAFTLGATLAPSSKYKYDLDGKIGLFANFSHFLSIKEIRDYYLMGRTKIF